MKVAYRKDLKSDFSSVARRAMVLMVMVGMAVWNDVINFVKKC